jgi:hypothetical protein
MRLIIINNLKQNEMNDYDKIYNLINTYNNEILFNKQQMIKFALKNSVAYNVASSKLESYQRVVKDLQEILDSED